MRQWERALRLASHCRPCRTVQMNTVLRCQFNSSATIRSDQRDSNTAGSSAPASSPPSSQPSAPRTNRGRREDALKQITRLRESRAKNQATETSKQLGSQGATAPPDSKIVTRRVPTSTVRHSRQPQHGSNTDGPQAVGVAGSGPRRGRRTPGAAGTDSKQGGFRNAAANVSAANNGEDFDEFDDDEDDGDEDQDEDDEDEDTTGMAGRPEDIMEEAGDEHFSSDAEQEYYAEILHKIRDIQLDLDSAESLYDLAEEHDNPKFSEEAKTIEANIDAGIKSVMKDLVNANDVAAPPHPTKPFDPAAEYKGMIGSAPVGTAGMGNTVEASLRHLADREDGDFRSPAKLAQRLIDGQFNRYNTLIEKNDTHIRAGYLRPAAEEAARKTRNEKSALEPRIAAKLRRKRSEARAAIRHARRAIDEGLIDANSAETLQELEYKNALVDAITKKLKLGHDKSAYNPMPLGLEQRREVVERLVQGRYEDPGDQRLQHTAMQNVARIVGANASYRSEAKSKVLETLRSMIPSEKANVRREQRQ